MTTTPEFPEHMARAIFQAAMDENRCGELLMTLFEGGSATVDLYTKKLVILPASALGGLFEAEVWDDED